MNPREQFLETLLFGAPDRFPFEPGAPRESTVRAWERQGLKGAWAETLFQLLDRKRAERGLAPAAWRPKQPLIELGVSFQMNPKFEEKVLEHKDGHYIVQDWMGAITEISDAFDYTYIRAPRDFVTRKWHRFPVQSWKDWEERIRWRFDARDPARFPADFEARCAQLRDREYPVILSFNGPFWQLREFCGMENLCTLMLEQPDLIEAMALFWRDFCSDVMGAVLAHVTPDMVHFSEDMCYKEHPMISPAMTEHFCGPCYRQWIDLARAAGVELFGIDSDGHIGLLIPVWMKWGINCVDPLEVAAGNDINAFRAEFGKKLSFRGGIDKRAIAAGGEVLRRELERVRPVLGGGGYIPSCDHGVPSDISWGHFQAYSVQLAEMTGWLA